MPASLHACTHTPTHTHCISASAHETHTYTHTQHTHTHQVPPEKDSYLDKFFAATKEMEPAEIADFLEEDDEMEEQHEEAATVRSASERD